MKTKRFKSIVCCDVILRRKDNILLMKRTKDDKYELPGGHLEENEDLIEAMIREAKEELGITLKRENLKLIHIMHHYNGKRINFIYEANGENLEPMIGEPEKCSKLLWVPITSIPEETTEKVKIILKNVEGNILYDTL